MLPQASTNRFGDLLRDILAPLNVDASKLDTLQRQMNEFWQRESVYRSWLQASSSEPYFPGMRSKSGRFDIEPLEAIRLQKSAASPQSIPDSTLTNLTWTYAGDKSKIFDGSSLSQVNISSDRYRVAGIVGVTEWAANATGYRSLRLDFCNSSGSAIYSQRMYRFLPITITDDWFPFAGLLPLLDSPTTASLKLTVWQSSGGALNLNYLDTAIFLLY